MEYITNNWMSIVLFLLQGGFLQFIFSRFQKYNEHHKAMESAICCLLRGEIISLCTKSQRQKYIAIYNLENLNSMYEAYHSLGGNGSIAGIYQKTCMLPHEVPKNEHT